MYFFFFFNYTLILGSEKLRSALRPIRKKAFRASINYQHNRKGYATVAQYQIYARGKKAEPADY